MDFKFQNINHGDSQIDLAAKLNRNFDVISLLGGGLIGIAGSDGSVGKTGPIGDTGPQGSQGYRGSRWFVQGSTPTSGVLIGDYLSNTSLDCEVFKYENINGSTDWVSQNFLISQYGVFGISNYQTGSTSGDPQFSYIQNLSSPSTKTFALTCATGSNIKNPQLSKVLVGTGGTTGYPLLEFSKYDYQNSSQFNLDSPKIKWSTTTTGSSDVYSLDFLSNNGISFNSRNFTARTYGRIRLLAGEYTGTNTGGITGEFSGNVNLNTSGSYALSSTGLINLFSDKLELSSQNIPIWDNTGLTANTSADFYSQASNSPTLYAKNGIQYTRSGSIYTASDYLLRVRYKGDSSSSNSQISSNKDHLLISSDGNVRFSAKISPFQFPGYAFSGGSLATGTFDASFESIAGQSFYTMVPTISEAAQLSTVNRWSFGDIRYFEYGANPGTVENALCISIPKDSVESDGFSYLIDGLNEAMSFQVYGFYGFNSIILDVPNSSPSTSFSFTGASTNFSLISPGDKTIYANLIEITLIREDSSDNWKCYYSASGGNINGSTTSGFATSGSMCGCLYK